MRIRGTIDVLKFDSKGYNAALRKAIEVQFRQAARAFIRAAVPLIPVETGMARGSFLNIGRYLRVAIPINPTKFRQRYYPGGLPKTPQAGANLSTPVSEIFNWDGDKLVFTFQSDVLHLSLEDQIGVRSPTAPWKAFDAGRDAFMSTLSGMKLPNVKSYITKTTITFGRGSKITSSPIRLRKQETS